LNPTLFKGVRHQRGNSDGIYTLKNKLTALGNHTRISSGSNGYLKTFEDNLDAASALLTQTVENA
jgi:hypothetical protein